MTLSRRQLIEPVQPGAVPTTLEGEVILLHEPWDGTAAAKIFADRSLNFVAPDRLHTLQKVLTELRERIFNLGRSNGCNGSGDKAVLVKLT